jgi:hypothetical protein
MTHRTKIAAACLCMTTLALLGGATLAADEKYPQWTYVEGGYLAVDVDNLSESGDNYFLGGSFGIGKNFHLIGSYTDGDLSDTVDQTTWRLGGGWNGGLGEKMDLVGELYWVDNETESSGPVSVTVSDDGYGATFGVRWRIIPLFELDGFLNYTDLDIAGDQTGWEARGILNIWKIGIGASYQIIDADNSDADQYNVFARFNFR